MKYFLSVLVLVMLTGSCNMQEPVDVSKVRKDESEMLASYHCSDVNFIKNLFEKNNQLKFFRCLNWDKEFPAIYSAIKEVPDESWNFLMGPFDRELFNDASKRNYLFSLLGQLDDEGALDDLSKILASWFDPGIATSINETIACAKKRSCNQELKEKDLITLFGSLASKEEDWKLLSSFFLLEEELYQKTKVDLYKLVEKTIGNEKHSLARLNWLNSSAQESLKNQKNFTTDAQIVSELFSAETEDNSGWLYSWLSSKEITSSQFERMIRFSVVDNPRLFDELYYIKSFLRSKISCTPYTNAGDRIYVDFKSNYYSFIDDFLKQERNQFFKTMLAHSHNLLAVTQICSSIRYLGRSNKTEEVTLDLLKEFATMANFLSNPASYSMAKFFFSLMQNHFKNDDERYEYFFTFFTSSGAKGLFDYLRTLHSIDPDSFKKIFNIVKELTPADWKTLSTVITRATSKEHFQELVSLSKLWLSLDKSSQQRILKIWDMHLEKGFRLSPILKFYAEVIYQFNSSFVLLGENFKNEDDRSTLHLQKTLNAFSKEDVLNELKRFSSKKQIKQIIRILKVAASDGRFQKAERTVIVSPRAFLPTSPPKYLTRMTDDEEKVAHCIADISKDSFDYYQYILDVPASCKRVNNKDVTTVMLGHLATLNESYKNYLMNEIGKLERSSLLDSTGILGTDSLRMFVGAVKVMNTNFSKNGKGARKVVDLLRENLFGIDRMDQKKGYLELVEEWLTLVKIKNDSEPTLSHRERVRLGELISRSESFERVGQFAQRLPSLVSSYQKYFSLNPELGRSYYTKKYSGESYPRCELSLNQKIGIAPCLSLQEFQSSVKRLLERARENYSGETGGRYQDQLISFFSPESGVNFPVGSLKKLKMTLSKALRFAYESSTKSKKTIPYRTSEKTIQVETTLLERVEMVAREIAFDGNYLGIHFINAIAADENFLNNIEQNKGIMNLCMKMGFCGKRLTSSHLKMARNAYDLLEVFPELATTMSESYSDLVQGFFSTLVLSSPKKARTVNLVSMEFFGKKVEVPWMVSGPDILNHSVRLLEEIVSYGYFSHIALWLHHEFKTESSFVHFISGSWFEQFSYSFLRGIPVIDLQATFYNLSATHSKTTNPKNETLFELVTNKMALMPYSDKMIIKDFASSLLAISGYLAPPSRLSKKSMARISLTPLEIKKYETLYKNNSVLPLLNLVSKLTPLWPVLVADAPWETKKLLENMAIANKLLIFVKESLATEGSSKESYFLVNDLFSMLMTFSGDKDASHLLFKALESKEFRQHLFKFLDLSLDFFERGHYQSSSKKKVSFKRFIELANFFSQFSKEKQIDLTPLQNYIKSTTMSCLPYKGVCKTNPHYDELNYLVKYLLIKNKEKTFLSTGLDTLLNIERSGILEIIETVFSKLEIGKDEL